MSYKPKFIQMVYKRSNVIIYSSSSFEAITGACLVIFEQPCVGALMQSYQSFYSWYDLNNL